MATETAVEQEQSPREYVSFEFEGETFQIKKKFKRLRFLRQIGNDPFGALALAFEETELERLEDLDLEADAIERLFSSISEVLVGGKGN